LPKAADLAELNRQLAAACRQDELRTISGRSQSIGAALLEERSHLLPLASEGMDLAHTSFSTVNGLGCVKVRTKLVIRCRLPAGTMVHAKAYAGAVELWQKELCGSHPALLRATSSRYWSWSTTSTCLWRKPGALAGSTALDQQRQAGLWPASFRPDLAGADGAAGETERYPADGRSAETRPQYGRGKLQESNRGSLGVDVRMPRRWSTSCTRTNCGGAGCDAVDVGALERYARPLPVMTEYDQLLMLGGAR